MTTVGSRVVLHQDPEQSLLILELIRKKVCRFWSSTRFWTVLRAQRELGIQIWRFSGPDIFFLKNIFLGFFVVAELSIWGTGWGRIWVQGPDLVQNRDFWGFLRGIGSQGGGKNSKIINSFGESMDISLKPVCTNFGAIPTNNQLPSLYRANFVDFFTGPCWFTKEILAFP